MAAAGPESDPRQGIAILALTTGGERLAARLVPALEGAVLYPCRGRLAATLVECWRRHRGLVCIMAAGIVVRTLAPLIEDKEKDPAVVVCDEEGRYAIPLLSGHLGGANDLARRVAAILGGEVVLTTSSDVQGLTALDLWARDLGLTARSRAELTRLTGLLVNRGYLRLAAHCPLPLLPPDLIPVPEDRADFLVSCRTDSPLPTLHPPGLTAGIGCNRNTPAAEIADLLDRCCRDHDLAPASVACLASIDLKKDEPGLLQLARERGLRLKFYHRDRLNTVEGVRASSEAVFRATGARGVAEPAAILAAGGPLLAAKMKSKNATCALAGIPDPLAADINRGEEKR